jgi:predicted AAA+ superfamily ATPase
MINRQLSDSLKYIITKMSVITLTGPRQSGKTTLAKSCFGDFTYINLEESDNRELALKDPRGFLKNNSGNLILDEAQYVPHLFSYIQAIVDQENNERKFVLTGSQNFLLLEKITQTLAGRAAIFFLLPLSIEELEGTKYYSENYTDYLFRGFYPRIYNKGLHPSSWFDDYLVSYVERDVRSITNIGDLTQFQRFVRLCAGRIGQLINFSDIGNEIGVSYHTVQSWLSILEASFIVFRLPPWFSSFNKRIIKSSKLYFYDTGLASYLLGIREKKELDVHFMRGALFENLIITELMKSFYNSGNRRLLYFWRDRSGNEIDCLLETAMNIVPVEIKSGQTISDDWLKGIRFIQKLTEKVVPEKSFLVYGGTESQRRTECQIVGWKNAVKLLKQNL